MVAVVVGFMAGRLRPPMGARGVRIQFRHLSFLGVGAAGNLVAYFLDEHAATIVLAGSLCALLAFVGSNTHVTGVVVIGLGLLLNLVALVVNNGMPVRGGALVEAGLVERAELATLELSGPRHLESRADALPVLGDVLPLPLGREVMSFGDLIVVAGAADAVRELARRRRSVWGAEERSTYRSTMTQLRAVHDWGTAPSAAPVSGSQYSANPDDTAPVTIDLTRPPLPRRTPSPLVSATHDK